MDPSGSSSTSTIIATVIVNIIKGVINVSTLADLKPLSDIFMPTLLLRPPAAILRQIPMIAPLAVCYAVEEAAGIIPDIKWPNDVQVEGKKLAGILIETSFEGEGSEAGFVLVGAGINVNIDPGTHDDLRLIATSLANELGHDVDREPLLAAYLLHFERLYDAAKAGVSAS